MTDTERFKVWEEEKVVGVQGFEPWTPCSQSRCATRLRHTPTKGDIIA